MTGGNEERVGEEEEEYNKERKTYPSNKEEGRRLF
jgi:hypothetical protein